MVRLALALLCFGPPALPSESGAQAPAAETQPAAGQTAAPPADASAPPAEGAAPPAAADPTAPAAKPADPFAAGPADAPPPSGEPVAPGDPTAPGPAATQPAAPTQPQPADPATATTPAPAPGMTPLPVDQSADPLGPEEAWKRDYVRVTRPRWRGTGLFITSGVVYGLGLIYQTVDTFSCGDCATGILERFFVGSAVAFAAGGGVLRGHADAYDDTAMRNGKRDTRKFLIAGATLTGVGAAIGLVNEAMWWQCAYNEAGPYSIDAADANEFSTYNCRYGTMRALLDLSTASTGVGLGMLTWTLTYNRDTRAYERARVIGLSPSFSPRFTGLTVQGRF